MGYIILFCLLVGVHGLLANVLERRPQTRCTTEVVSNIKTNLNSQKNSFDKITKTNDSTRLNRHPTDDFNKQIAEYDTDTAPLGRVSSTSDRKILETSQDKPKTSSKKLETKLSPYRALKNFLRRLLMGTKLERELASKFVPSSSQAQENSAADNTERYSRNKSGSDTVHSRVESHMKSTGLKENVQAEFRRVHPATGHPEDAIISAFLRRYSRRIFEATVARFDDIARRELRRIVQKARRARSSRIAADREAARKGEALEYQMPPYPRNKDKKGPPSSYEDEKGPSSAYQAKDGPPVAYQDQLGPPVANEDKDGPHVVYQDKGGPPVAYQDQLEPPGAYQDEYDELRQDGSDSYPGGSFDGWLVSGMEAVEADGKFRRVRRGAADVPSKPGGAATTAPAGVVEDPASEPGLVGTEPPAGEQRAMVVTTAGPPSKMPVVLGLLGGMVLGAVLATIIICVYLKSSKKTEKEPLKPGAAPGAGDKAAKDIAATASQAALKKTPSKAKDAGKDPGGAKRSAHNAPPKK